ncbi:hypothetical protein [Streptomyces celluloflavus]|uniref:hypothetical protein n=1 Tax=Streptomyces celluloflavus TaxID=58344 RepID=UPI00369F8EBE
MPRTAPRPGTSTCANGGGPGPDHGPTLTRRGAALAVGVAFLIASVSGSGALVDSYRQSAAAEVGPSDVQATPRAAQGQPAGLTEKTAARARRVPEVAAVHTT